MEIKYDANGLVPAIAQDIATGEVLMLAYMNEESVQLTLDTTIAHYYSRSRKEIWKKGATSGNSQEVKSFQYDCDGDAILIKVVQTGVACHAGTCSCFTNELKSSTVHKNTIGDLYKVVLDRKLNPVEGSYTAYLFNEGVDKILKKVGEESAEVIIGAKNNKQELVYEASDLVYHLLVLLVNEGVPLGSLYEELAKRMK